MVAGSPGISRRQGIKELPGPCKTEARTNRVNELLLSLANVPDIGLPAKPSEIVEDGRFDGLFKLSPVEGMQRESGYFAK